MLAMRPGPQGGSGEHMAGSPLAWLQDARPGDHARWAAMAAVMLLAWLGLEQLSAQLWFLPAGLRLGLLWLVPTRRWGWLAAAEIGAQATKSLVLGWPIFSTTFLAVACAPWVIYAGVVLVLRGPGPAPVFDGPARMVVFLLAGLLSAAGVSPLLWAFLVTIPMTAEASLASVFAFMYGDLIGQLVLAPLLVAGAHGLPRWRQTRFWRDLALAVAGALVIFMLLHNYRGLADYLLLLAFAPLFVLGFRHGWEGAAVGTVLLGVLIQSLIKSDVLVVNVVLLQLVLAVVGSGALVLGAAATALRLSREALAERHRELAVKNGELAALAAELRHVSQRLVRMEEQGQRELASELDYELGHAIHALGTRISLAFRDVRDEQGTRFLESLREQVREIQDSLRRALRQLRPTMLDSHGLRHALQNGPLRDMLDDAGIGFECHLEAAADSLDDDARTTIYRITQAAVREAVRLEQVRRVALRLRVPGPPARVELDIEMEFASFAEHLPPPQPLSAIRDRVLAERGRYVVEPLVQGLRHRIGFALATPDA